MPLATCTRIPSSLHSRCRSAASWERGIVLAQSICKPTLMKCAGVSTIAGIRIYSAIHCSNSYGRSILNTKNSSQPSPVLCSTFDATLSLPVRWSWGFPQRPVSVQERPPEQCHSVERYQCRAHRRLYFSRRVHHEYSEHCLLPDSIPNRLSHEHLDLLHRHNLLPLTNPIPIPELNLETVRTPEEIIVHCTGRITSGTSAILQTTVRGLIPETKKCQDCASDARLLTIHTWSLTGVESAWPQRRERSS